MSALQRPDLPPGPRRELSDALHDLHHRAGWPSLRALARRTGVSHTTIAKAMSAPALPAWGTLELLVEALHGDTARFHELWLAASSPEPPAGRRVPLTRIAGRRTELAAVHRHLANGTGLLVVTGEAGIGKTTLLQAAGGSTEGFVALGRCLPSGAQLPLMPVIDVLTAIHDVDDGRWIDAALAQLPPFAARSLARLLPQIGRDLPAAENDEFARQRLFTSVDKVLACLAALRPLALMIEDLHWADPATLLLLEHLLGREDPLAIVGAWRTEDDTIPQASLDWFARVERLPTVTVVGLAPLTRHETSEQLALLGVRQPEQVDRIHARSLGQPLFTEQLAAHHDGDRGLPDRLGELLDRRLVDLTRSAWAVLRVLAVAERPLAPGQLADASGLFSDELTGELHGLRRRRLVRTTSDERVHLQHPLLAEAAQRRLVAGEAVGVHRALAEVLGAGSEASPAEVARHWQGACDRDRELDWRVRAARASAAAFDWAGEAEHWLRVLELWPPELVSVGDPPLTRPLVYLAAIDALDEALEWDHAVALSDSAEAELGEVDDAVRAELLARAATYRGDREGCALGLTILDEALEIFARLPASAGYLRALNQKRGLLVDLGLFDEATAVVREAIGIAQAVGDRRLERHHRVTLAWHEGVTGAVTTMAETLREAQALVADDADPVGDIRTGVITTDALLTCGRPLEEVEEAAKPGLQVARTWGIGNTLPMMLVGNVATARLRAGRVADARAIIGVLSGPEADVPEDRPPDPARWPLEVALAAVATRRGRLDDAAERIAVVLREVVVDDEIDLEVLCMAADVDFWRGTAHLTLARLLRALEVFVRSAPLRTFLPALVTAERAMAEGALTTRPESDAQRRAMRDLLARSARRVVPQDECDVHIRVHLAAAEAEILRAEDRCPVDRWARAASGWDQLGRPHDAAYCRWRAAQAALRRGQGSAARRLLDRAATDARDHVPLSGAIAATRAAAGARSPA